MILKKITIHNYKSIEKLYFKISQLNDETYTYGLIGVNEAGKSTILKAIALKDGLKDEKGQILPLAIDFKDENLPIRIEYCYFLNKEEIKECREYLKTQSPDINSSKINLSEINLIISFNHTNPSQSESVIDIRKLSEENEEKLKIEEQLKQLVLQKSYKSIFWTAEDRYLISQPINLDQFATDPEDVSIPLKNCFLLAGIKENEIQTKIRSLANDSTKIEELQNNLGEVVTKHIKRVWPKHPIEITFLITGGLIHFHVKDSKVKGRAKTANQRSDGFRQFISFLLTVSAENEKKQLSNSILLLDEPETHLHPQAQEDLLQELIKITKNKNNNITFFATHSNYMIDKKDLSRNYKIVKPEKTDVTEREQFNKKISSYASVTYEVFDIASTDYHNELYGKMQEISGIDNITEFDKKIQDLDKKCPIKKNYEHTNGKKFNCTLPTYIRHQVHHPDNTKNTHFTDDELRNSIEILIDIIDKFKKE